MVIQLFESDTQIMKQSNLIYITGLRRLFITVFHRRDSHKPPLLFQGLFGRQVIAKEQTGSCGLILLVISRRTVWRVRYVVPHAVPPFSCINSTFQTN